MFNIGLFDRLRFDRIRDNYADFINQMMLGTWALPAGTRISTSQQTLETRKRTYGGTLKREIRAQKKFHTLEMPIQTGLEFEGLKGMKEARTSVLFRYKDENGSGDTGSVVSIGDLTYIRMKEYDSGMYIDKIRLTLEEV